MACPARPLASFSHTLAGHCEQHAERLHPFGDRYGEEAPSGPDRLHSELFTGTRSGGLGLLRDLQDLYLMATDATSPGR